MKKLLVSLIITGIVLSLIPVPVTACEIGFEWSGDCWGHWGYINNSWGSNGDYELSVKLEKNGEEVEKHQYSGTLQNGEEFRINFQGWDHAEDINGDLLADYHWSADMKFYVCGKLVKEKSIGGDLTCGCREPGEATVSAYADCFNNPVIEGSSEDGGMVTYVFTATSESGVDTVVDGSSAVEPGPYEITESWGSSFNEFGTYTFVYEVEFEGNHGSSAKDSGGLDQVCREPEFGQECRIVKTGNRQPGEDTFLGNDDMWYWTADVTAPTGTSMENPFTVVLVAGSGRTKKYHLEIPGKQRVSGSYEEHWPGYSSGHLALPGSLEATFGNCEWEGDIEDNPWGGVSVHKDVVSIPLTDTEELDGFGHWFGSFPSYLKDAKFQFRLCIVEGGKDDSRCGNDLFVPTYKMVNTAGTIKRFYAKRDPLTGVLDPDGEWSSNGIYDWLDNPVQHSWVPFNHSKWGSMYQADLGDPSWLTFGEYQFRYELTDVARALCADGCVLMEEYSLEWTNPPGSKGAGEVRRNNVATYVPVIPEGMTREQVDPRGLTWDQYDWVGYEPGRGDPWDPDQGKIPEPWYRESFNPMGWDLKGYLYTNATPENPAGEWVEHPSPGNVGNGHLVLPTQRWEP